ncbi:MAG: S8 family peptidase [Halanaerobiaceae bacterium]
MKIDIKRFCCMFLSIILTTFLFAGCSVLQQNSENRGFITGKIVFDSEESIKLSRISDPPIEEQKLVKGVSSRPLQVQTKTNTYIIDLEKKYTAGDLEKQILKGKGTVKNKITEKTYTVELKSSTDLDPGSITDHNDVAYIEPDYLVQAQSKPNDPQYNYQWNLDLLNLESTWKAGFKGDKEIKIAIIDTGITEHQDLKDNLIYKNNKIYGRDFIDDDHHPLDETTGFKHGTHVAGIIGATTNNALGIAGINWKISLLPVRVIGPEGGTTSDLTAGIRWAADNGAQIINLSLATMNGAHTPRSLQEAVQYADQKGVLLIAASGNNGLNAISYPARFPEVISVGAINEKKERAPFSNYGTELDLMAPGTDILSTDQKNSYEKSSGTSMAAPHVAGAAALLYSSGITEPAAMKKKLLDSADKDQLININQALNLEQQNTNKADQLPERVKVYAARKTEKKLELVGDPAHPDENGNFTLEIKEGNWQIIAWGDQNENGQLDKGDFYREIKKVKVNNRQTKKLGNISLAQIN